MKTPEDEAFDDLARRQGAWGGGYRAKRAAAADKQEPWNEDEWRKNNWRCQHGWLRGEQCEICNASLAPKPAHCQCTACKDGIFHASDCAVHNGPAYPIGPCDCGVVQEPAAWMCSAFDGGPCEQSNHDDCENPIPLYTAPPQREWIGLTDDELADLWYKESLDWMEFARAVEQLLKEKNT